MFSSFLWEWSPFISQIHTTRASWTTRASPEVPSTWFGPVARGAVSAVLTLWPMYRSSKPVKCSTEMSHTVGEATRNWLYQSFRYNLISVHRLKSWNFNCDNQVIFFKFLLTMISWKKFSSSFRWNIQMNDFSVTCTFSEHIFISYNFYLLIFNTFKLYLLRFVFQIIFLCLYHYFVCIMSCMLVVLDIPVYLENIYSLSLREWIMLSINESHGVLFSSNKCLRMIPGFFHS